MFFIQTFKKNFENLPSEDIKFIDNKNVKHKSRLFEALVDYDVYLKKRKENKDKSYKYIDSILV